jgi:hypothetical protein
VALIKAQPVGHVDRRLVEGDIAVGDLGLAEVKLTEIEEAVLSEAVRVEDVAIKDSGEIYLPHIVYTRWFNRAFGRTGWSLVPVGKPTKATPEGKATQVIIPYVLHVHRQPVAFALGEQEYYEDNRKQTYGDALESTVASALRRCAKRLGVGLELWDREWVRGFLAEHAQSWREDGKTVWGLKRTSHGRHASEGRPEPPPARDRRTAGDQRRPTTTPGHDRTGGQAISDKQRQRLWVIIKNSGRSEEEVRAWLQQRWGWTSTRQVTRGLYDYVCAAVESNSRLPEADPGSRE